MADNRADWTIMRGTVIGFAICALVSAAMLAASVYFKQNMEREYRANHARFRHASQQYLAVDEEERIIEEFYPVFVRMARQGLLGRERRLSWLESLREAGEAIRVPELSYKLEARRETDPHVPLALGGYRLHTSPMRLNLGLLHEGDLFRLLGALDREALGQYSVERCELRRREGELTLEPDTANVEAECVLNWLTVDLAGERELEL